MIGDVGAGGLPYSRPSPASGRGKIRIQSPRPAKRGERLSCESSDLLGPRGPVADDSVEDGEELPHASDKGDLG